MLVQTPYYFWKCWFGLSEKQKTFEIDWADPSFNVQNHLWQFRSAKSLFHLVQPGFGPVTWSRKLGIFTVVKYNALFCRTGWLILLMISPILQSWRSFENLPNGDDIFIIIITQFGRFCKDIWWFCVSFIVNISHNINQ